jgi:hypothetical protein
MNRKHADAPVIVPRMWVPDVRILRAARRACVSRAAKHWQPPRSTVALVLNGAAGTRFCPTSERHGYPASCESASETLSLASPLENCAGTRKPTYPQRTLHCVPVAFVQSRFAARASQQANANLSAEGAHSIDVAQWGAGMAVRGSVKELRSGKITAHFVTKFSLILGRI